MSVDLPRVWTEDDLREHRRHCVSLVELSDISSAFVRRLCACGEAAMHTPEAVAWAEIERDCPRPVL